MASTPAARDKDLYLDTIVVRVGDVLFKVPRAILAGSPVFDGMFSMPASASAPEGESDERPLTLELKADEFRLFVRAASCHLMGGTARLNIPAWKAVLRLADMWALDALRAAAIAQLDAQLGEAEAAQRLQIAYAFKLPNWIVPAMRQLIADRARQVLEIREMNVTETSLEPFVHDGGQLRYTLCDDAEKNIEHMFGADAAQ